MLLVGTFLWAGCGGSSETDSTATTGEIEYEAEPVPGGRAPAGASAASCDSQAVDAEALRATGLSCEGARQVMFAWQREAGCDPGGESRGGCTARSYRCAAVRTDRGTAVDCSRRGRSVAFVATRR